MRNNSIQQQREQRKQREQRGKQQQQQQQQQRQQTKNTTGKQPKLANISNFATTAILFRFATRRQAALPLFNRCERISLLHRRDKQPAAPNF